MNQVRSWAGIGALIGALALAACSEGGTPRARASASSGRVTASTSTSTLPGSAPDGTEPALPPAPAPQPVLVATGRLAGVINRVPTSQPVVFLTIDDGWVRDPRVLALVQAQHLPVSIFLIDAAARGDPAYFRALEAAGATVEDHTLTHPYLNRLSLGAQQRQICGAATDEARLFGARVTLVRPPYGAMNQATRQAARGCGMRAVIEWSAAMDAGELTVRGGRLGPGDIILLHFRPTLAADLTALLDKIRAAGLTVGRLEDYLG